MATQIFLNFAVKDLPRSKAFFGALGYSFNADYTNDDAACMVIDDGHIYAMLLREEFFLKFTDLKICDTRTHVEAMTALTVESREQVDQLVAKAVAAGGRTPRPPTDYGFMYSHMFEDLDGHLWEFVHMSGEPAKE